MGEEKYSEKTLFQFQFTTNCAWTCPVENPGLCGEKTATKSQINRNSVKRKYCNKFNE
jgi:hypothetical protein